MPSRKVFGIGLNKTGTTTLKRCLETLGYSVKGPDLELTRAATEGRLAAIFDVCEHYDAFQDWPWPLVYKRLNEHYANSKFILTTRADRETWFESLKRHAERTGPTEYRSLVYGHEMPHEHRQEHLDIYETHQREVRAYFEGRRNDLLEVCWETGTGWDELCDFLDHEAPEIPLPHVHKRKGYIEGFINDIKSTARSVYSAVKRTEW